MKRRILWAGVAIVAGCALLSTAMGARRLQVSEIRGLVVGEIVLTPADTNPLPIGRGGFATGFAFAPGRAELAYCALEDRGEEIVSVLRIVQADRVWPVERTVTQERVIRGHRHTYYDLEEVELPFAERERELLSTAVAGAGDRIWQAFMEGPILWSPDGSKLAVYVVQDAAAKGAASRDVWVVNYASGEKVAMTQGAWVTGAAWGPDSRRLALAVERPGKEGTGGATGSGLWVADTASGEWLRAARAGAEPEWRREGGKLLFRATPEGKEWQEYDFESKKVEAASGLTAAPGGIISPDRTLVAEIGAGEEGRKVVIRQRQGGNAVVRVPGVKFACWAADGRSFAYFDAGGALQMSAVEGPHAGQAVKVTANAEQEPLPFGRPVQWSSHIAPAQEEALKHRANLQPRPEVSWMAMIGAGRLQVQRIIHRPPDVHERAALGQISEEEERKIAESNMKQLALAVLMYSNDWDEMAPPAQFSVPDIIEPYIRNRDIYDRPGYPDQPAFKYMIENPGDLPRLRNPSIVPMAVVNYFEDGGYVAFCDGHVRWISKERWDEVLEIGRREVAESLANQTRRE